MPIRESLKSLPEPALWEFMKWLAFSHGRYVGIRIDPHQTSNNPSTRIRFLAETLALAVKQPEDAMIGLRFPVLHPFIDDLECVADIAEYLEARNIALNRSAADFDPRDAHESQERALNRIVERLEGAKR